MENGIFISYRRADSAGTAGRLKDHLDQAFGSERVFKDVEDIPAGADFRKVIGHELMSSNVILILMGQQYLTLKDAEGNVRIFSEDDYVNIEASTALTFRNQKMVVPVLVNGAPMPSADQLPDNLKDLAFLNAVNLSHQSWRPDVQKLVSEIKKFLKEDQAKTSTHTPSNANRSTEASQAKRRPAPPPSSNKTKKGSSMLMGMGIGIFAVIIALSVMVAMVDDEPVNDLTEKQGFVDHSISFSAFTGYVDATKLNVRNQPGTTDSEVLFQLEQGEAVKVIAMRPLPDKDWYRIDNGQQKGWVSSDFIAKTAPVSNALSSSAQPTNTGNSYSTQTASNEYQQEAQYQQEQQYTAPQSSGSSYQTAVIGTWELTGFETNGSFVSLADAMAVAMGQVVSARELYTLNGSTIQIDSYLNGEYIPNELLTYSISGDQFLSSDGFVGTIQSLDRQNLQIYDPTLMQIRHYRRIQ